MGSLHTKLIIAFLAISLVGTLLAAAYVWWTTTQEFNLFLTVQNRASILERLAEAYRTGDGWERLERLPDGALGPPRMPHAVAVRNRIAVVDAAGRVVWGGRGYQRGEMIPLRDYQEGVPILVDGREVGRLLLEYGPAMRDQPWKRFMNRFYLALGLGTVSGTVIALLLGVVVARSLTSPLRELTQATRAMSAGDLDQHIPVRSDDELGELARSFNQLSDDLLASRELRRQMTADIAHELRTPLSLILGHAEGLVDGVLPASAETYEIIHDEARRLNRLIDDLRTLTLSDAGELTLEREAISPGALLERAAAAHGADAESQGVALTLDVEDDLPLVNADSDRIAQVLHNLLSNALRYTPEEGSIVLSAAMSDEGVSFAVRDTGPGIPEEELERIFDRFYREDKARHRHDGGAGLGLAIAKSLVERHGGRMWAESEVGRGTAFYFTLPAA
ncbi:MAG: ATP-binding protein [Chloroflexota bacterium]|nr:ATP-binding protein [Chloroflexota bacterium]